MLPEENRKKFSVFLKIAMAFVFIKKNISMSKHAQAQIKVDYFFFHFHGAKEGICAFPSLIVFVDIIEGNRRQLNFLIK